MTEPDLQALARNIHHGRVITSIGARDSGDLARRFMALTFAKPALLRKIRKANPGLLYRYSDDVGSLRWLSRTESSQLNEILAELAAREV